MALLYSTRCRTSPSPGRIDWEKWQIDREMSNIEHNNFEKNWLEKHKRTFWHFEKLGSKNISVSTVVLSIAITRNAVHTTVRGLSVTGHLPEQLLIDLRQYLQFARMPCGLISFKQRHHTTISVSPSSMIIFFRAVRLSILNMVCHCVAFLNTLEQRSPGSHQRPSTFCFHDIKLHNLG